MVFDGTTALVLLIIFLSILVRTVFGFGNALVAMPLLAMTAFGMKNAAPLIALLATLHALILLIKDWRVIEFRPTWRLLVATIPGVPLGILLLVGPFEKAGKILLALIIIAFSVYSLAKPRLATLKAPWPPTLRLPLGILAGAYNSGGPPIIIYATLCKWAPDRFRTTLQGFFFPSSVATIAGHAMGADHAPGGVVFSPLPAGHRPCPVGGILIQRRLPQRSFEKYVYLLLITHRRHALDPDRGGLTGLGRRGQGDPWRQGRQGRQGSGRPEMPPARSSFFRFLPIVRAKERSAVCVTGS
jgi:uncharacterized membrane protein YfcA